MPIDKAAVLDALLRLVTAQLASITDSQRETQAGATHAEARPEHDKDTRATEASYLARGLAARVGELRLAVTRLSTLQLRRFDADAAIGLTALVTLREDDGAPAHYFLAPAGSGLAVSIDGVDISVVTPQSPLGRELLGKHRDDDLQVRTPRGVRAFEIVAVA